MYIDTQLGLHFTFLIKAYIYNASCIYRHLLNIDKSPRQATTLTHNGVMKENNSLFKTMLTLCGTMLTLSDLLLETISDKYPVEFLDLI